MFKIINKILIVLLLPMATNAQSFKASIIGGINASQVSGDELGGFNKAGVMFGGSAILPVTPKSDVAMELLFIQKGSKTPTSKDNSNTVYYKMSLNYLEVQINYTYHASKKIGLHVGPTFGVLVGEKEEDIAGELTERPEFQKTEIGIAGGLSFHFSEKVGLYMRLSNSLLPIRKMGADTKYFKSGQYNSGLAFFLTYTFSSKDKQKQ
ncbi:MAG TPA: porin family protein [Bacteroidia bacterium]|nr:PorT family protein [Bacteroidia bacterium]QQR96212.1 MAG: PorT family protein [Bacteroidota bacterium]MBP7713808.1 PorT family protein [Bacteroidia bacterium]MBP8668388.1 PorT family protein [Bacteroidia bacterium]HOZ83701.1 porin family protein [Bacteroidia bacterium]